MYYGWTIPFNSVHYCIVFKTSILKDHGLLWYYKQYPFINFYGCTAFLSKFNGRKCASRQAFISKRLFLISGSHFFSQRFIPMKWVCKYDASQTVHSCQSWGVIKSHFRYLYVYVAEVYKNVHSPKFIFSSANCSVALKVLISASL